MKQFKYTAIAALIAMVSLTSCGSDYMDTAPTNKTPQDEVLATIDNLYSALNGTHRAMYIQYGRQSQGGEASMNIERDMLGEDLINPSTGNGWFVGESRWIDHRNTKSYFSKYPFTFYYKLISNANLILESIDNATGEDEVLRAGIKGQALCYRAWAHFQLVQLYGKRYDGNKTNNQLGVPYNETSGIKDIARNTVEEVYEKANADIDQAIELLKEYKAENVNHFSLEVAYGVKARIALVQQNWKVATEYATLAIQAAQANGRKLQSGEELLKGFVDHKENSEWMWASIMYDDQTIYFYSFFAFMSWNFNSPHIRQSPKCILDRLYAKISPTDIRRKWWDPTGEESGPNNSFATYKYQNRKFTAKSSDTPVGDVVYMRLAEMYLIKAEAEARSKKEAEAKQTLFEFATTRDPEYKISTNTGDALVEEILTQRRIELWGEGFRFTDLKRLNMDLDRRDSNHDEAVSQTMYVPAGDKKWEIVISQTEMDANPLMEQNEL